MGTFTYASSAYSIRFRGRLRQQRYSSVTCCSPPCLGRPCSKQQEPCFSWSPELWAPRAAPRPRRHGGGGGGSTSLACLSRLLATFENAAGIAWLSLFFRLLFFPFLFPCSAFLFPLQWGCGARYTWVLVKLNTWGARVRVARTYSSLLIRASCFLSGSYGVYRGISQPKASVKNSEAPDLTMPQPFFLKKR